MAVSEPSDDRIEDVPTCRVLARWIDKGGPMPIRLARHVTACPACAAWAARVARVQGALTLLATGAAPVGILGRANDKALRMLTRRTRQDDQARELRGAKPPAKFWPTIEGPTSRAAATAAAAMVILSLNAAVADGMEQTRDMAQALADCHYERHIDDGDLLA